MFMMYLHTKFHIHSLNSALVIAISLRAKYTLNAAVIFLCYITHAGTHRQAGVHTCTHTLI